MIFSRVIFSAAAAGIAINIFAAAQNTITYPFSFEPPVINEQADNTCRVVLDNTRPDDIPGKPALPIFITNIEIPDGFQVDTVTLNRSPVQGVRLRLPVVHAQPYFKPGEPPVTTGPDPLVYEKDAAYPADSRLLWRTDPTEGKTLLSVSFSPLQYNPKQSMLYYSREISVNITLSQPQANIAVPAGKLNTVPSPLNHDERCDYLIISTSNLIERAVPPWDFNALLERRSQSGYRTKILPVEWIYENYTGADHPEQIRRFLQDAHTAWGLKYLLIAGTHQMIPARLLHIEVGGIFENYVEDIPADHIYYGCMDGTYDGNGNGLYGEYNDGDGGGDVDLTAEVLTGRFPVENEIELANMVRKTLRYDLAAREEFSNNGFVSEIVNFGAIVYGKPFMEEIRNGSTAYGRNTLGYTNSPYTEDFITTNNLHDSSTFTFGNSDILNYLTNNLHSINHLGHGSKFQCFKLNVAREQDRTAIAALNNPFPYFVYSQACLSGAFDTKDCFAEYFVTVSNAASAVIMNSRNGWASTSGVYGPSHYFHRHFWDSAFRGNAVTFGEMNEASHRANLGSVPSFNASLWRWVYYELNLLGDPAQPVIPALLNVKPTFSHNALPNTYNAASNYTVACEMEPVGIYDPESIRAVWSVNGGGAITQKMTCVEGNQYRMEIPAQPRQTRIDYQICATNRAGYASSEPETGTHTFYVTDELNLLIAGSPTNIGTVEPDYGIHSSASGIVINASCVTTHCESEDTRDVNLGFTGAGSVPTDSTNHFVSFRIDTDSILMWRWQKEHRILISSSIATPPDSTYWIKEGASFTPPAAELFVTDPHTNLFAFAGWELDGARSPALPEKSTPQHPAFIVNTPGTLRAIYIPAELDSDENGIADWWELQYFGAPGQNIYSDHDEDGYDLYEEFEDRSDPLDSTSFPAAPIITHIPLSSPMSRPGPYLIRAVITDTHAVTNAAVLWRINSGTWQSTPLSLISNNIYEASIAGGTSPGDIISYSLEAQDPSGDLAVTATWNIFLSYPVADFSLMEDIFAVTKPDVVAITNTSLLINRGNSALNWSLTYGLEERFKKGSLDALINWDTRSIEQPWTISTNHVLSPPYAIHASLVSTKDSSHHASITMPPVLIGTDATLRFSYWMNSEIYTHDPSRAFDGGIVEYSTDEGATFHQLAGPYTHEVYGWAMSPWPDKTPCFAGLSFGWREAVFDLAESYPDTAGFEGQNVIFRFVYGGDDNTDLEGWYVDNIRISPAALPAGFSCTLPEINPYTTAPGGYSELLLRNLPAIMDSRSENTSVFIDSNAPTNSIGSFQWQALVRDDPEIHSFAVNQITNENGAVGLTATTREVDNEPLDLTLEWSVDRGHHWQRVSLTNITTAPQHADIPEYAPDGEIPGIPGIMDFTPLTNQINAIWNSAAPQTDIGWNSNVFMRLTAASPWFTTTETCVFPVDNIAPLFGTGALSAGPQGEGGDYLISSNAVSLEWPAAVDTPAENPLIYRVYSGTELLATYTNLTQAMISMTNRLDCETTLRLVPSDPIGNHGEPLELTALILDPAGDYDNDGTSTGREEAAGTDAGNPLSLFIIKSLEVATGGFSISWSSETGRSYSVETTANLSQAEWTAVEGLTDIPGTGEIIIKEVPKNERKEYFRVRVFKQN